MLWGDVWGENLSRIEYSPQGNTTRATAVMPAASCLFLEVWSSIQTSRCNCPAAILLSW